MSRVRCDVVADAEESGTTEAVADADDLACDGVGLAGAGSPLHAASSTPAATAGGNGHVRLIAPRPENMPRS
ncbi:hypothetical protein WKI71_04060 [Streptomyces sp. MS1.AVA.1]|uniref:Uncharacterized protein n=1 Tax=Streptomyces machairae TaxID=3134109 RepID=A0ABU8UI75_9ACTN